MSKKNQQLVSLKTIFFSSCIFSFILIASVAQASIFDVPNPLATINHKPLLLDCDIAGAGGGIGETTAAIATARNGRQVCLYERNQLAGRTADIGLRVVSDQKKYDVYADVTIDATDWGDLIALGNIPHDLGPDKNSNEPLAQKIPECLQPITHTAILE